MIVLKRAFERSGGPGCEEAAETAAVEVDDSLPNL